MPYSDVLSVLVSASSAAPLYVLAARAPRPVINGLNLRWSSGLVPPISHIRPAPSFSQQLHPPLGARILKATAPTHETTLWGTDAQSLETLDELVFEVRNDSYLFEECSLVDGDGTAATASTRDSSLIARLVENGCAVSPEVRLLQPLSRLDPQCQKQQPTLLEPLPSTDSAQLCSNCHPFQRLAVSRAFLERAIASYLSTWNSSRVPLHMHIECTLVGFEERPDGGRSSGAAAALSDSNSEESVAYRRALWNLGFDLCNVRIN